MQTFNVIKTDKEIYIQTENTGYRSSHETHPFLFDGKKSRDTFHKEWAAIDKMPKEISMFKSGEIYNIRYELINPQLASNNIPKEILAKNVEKDEDCNWIGKYNGLQSLYKYEHSKREDSYVLIDFHLKIIHTIDKIEEYTGFSYPVKRGRWDNDGFKDFTADGIRHPMVDEILFPDIIKPSRPSFLSSKDSYDIVRAHIKSNINPKYAEILSDCDFCFTVAKKISVHEPEKYVVNIGTSKKPKHVTRYRASRSCKIFEMTYSPENYKGYTPLPGFTGSSHKNLKENIDKFLNELMLKINEPLKDCAHCNGMGVILEKAP